MGAFSYSALDPRGRRKRGVLEGDNPRQVRQKLREQGLMPLEVAEVAQEATRGGGGFQLRRGLGATDLALVTRQLATLLRSGLQLEEALGAVARQSGRERVERILLAVRAKVREGHTLAAGLAEFPAAFNDLYVRTVEAGEQAGHLDLVLERLADYTESRQEMRQKTLLALFYPALLVLMSIAILVGLLTFVVPKVVNVFENAGQELPWLTRTLIQVSDFLRENGVLLLVVLLVALFLFRQLMRRPGPRMAVHRLLLRLPLVGRLARGVNAARFSRTLAILTASTVPILEAMRISARVLTNLPMREAVEQAAVRVREGSSLHKALEQTGYFPPLTQSLIASGEASGDLQGMLERSAVIQEREVETLISAFLGLFEPLLIVLMGGMVLIIVLAILMPIFDLNQLVAG